MGSPEEAKMIVPNSKWSLSVLIIGLLVTIIGCQNQRGLPTNEHVFNTTSQPTVIENANDPIGEPARTKTVTITTAPSRTPSPTSTLPPAIKTWTPLPTLSRGDAEELVLDLLKNNRGCKLPCWWGIRPGNTDWQETTNFLSSFSVGDPYIFRSSNSSYFVSWFNFLLSEDKSKQVIQGYTVRNEIVEFIEVRFSNVQTSTLNEFLNMFGQPGEAWIRTFGTEYQSMIPFYLILFYPDQGILALYESNDAKLNGDKVQKCFTQDTVYELALWPPEREYSFEEASSQTEGIKFDDSFPLFPLEEATGLDIGMFYQSFLNPDSSHCLETPAELWPGQFQ
jgi:hypothetical protein